MPADGGASVAPHPGRTTQLMYACSQGDLQQVKRLLHDQPTSLHHLDRTQRTPLHYCAGGATTLPATPAAPPAARLSHCADLLLMAAPDLVHSRDQDGFTPLHLAVIAGNVQLVQFLLANGADVKAKDGELHSVVHWATVCGETAALQAVLAAGAEVSTPDVHGGYPLHYAAQMCGSEKPDLGLQVLHILLSSPGIIVSVTDNDGRQPLLWAASAGSARAVLALVRAGAAVEASDRDGLTALHCAASRGHTDTLDTLLTLCGAQTDVIDSNGCTALHYSVTLGHADATALLLSHSADPNLQDRKGRSPAHCGCAKGQLETVRQLHASGANLWLRTARGDLPLHEAAASGRRQLVRWLLDQRPSQVNSRNNDGRGLLHLAALNDNADMCKILLDSGAAVNPLLRTSKNVFMTPLDCALQRGFRSTAKFLQLHGGVPASRLNSLRLSSELATNVTSGSHLHIRDDITIFGGSSSETDLENKHKSKDHRGRRKTVRRKLSYRHERRRSYSGSEPEVEVRAKSTPKSAHEKTGKKQEAERRAKSRDDLNKIKAGDHKSKSDGKQSRRKKHEVESEDSLSETETSPEIIKDKDRRKRISETERLEHQNGAISNLESSKKIIPPDYERKKPKKSHQNDSSHEISDTEKSKRVASDRDRRKKKNHSKEEGSYDEDPKNVQKQRSSNEEQKLSHHEPLEHKEHSSEEKSKKKSEDIEVKKQKKSKKSDISDSDTQKNRISDSERRKKKSADKKSQKEKLSEENESEEKVSQEIKKDKIKQKSASKSKSSQEELNSQNKREATDKEELKSSTVNVDEQLQNQQDTTKSDKRDSAKSVKHETEIVNTESKSEETKSSTEDTSAETTKDATLTQQEPEDGKHLEKDTEQPSDKLQPDQISLQSKLSEESPSKTIVVEAAVHHPPKGMSTENIHEELAAVAEDSKEISDEVLDKTQEAKTEEVTIVDKQITEDGTEESKTEIEPKEEVDKTSEQTTVLPKSSEKESIVAGEELKTTVEEESQEPVPSADKVVTNSTQEVDSTVPVEENNKINTETITTDGTEVKQNVANEVKEVEQVPKQDTTSTELKAVAEESSTVETKEIAEQPTTAEAEDQKQDDTDSKKELNIDLSLKKFEESAELQNEVTDVDENENLKEATVDKESEVPEESKQKKYRKKVKISKSKEKKDGTEQPEDVEESSSTSRETSSSESESEKSVKKSKISESKNSEHKSFKILNDDVAFEVLKESPVKESRRVRKASKKRQKETERLNESATSSPEMLESVRTRSKSVPRQKDSNQQSVTLPSLVEKRPESNLSAPNLSSVYSDNEQKSGSNSEVDDLMSSASRKKRLKRRSKLRVGSKSAGSDYESSNLIDSGFEPSPRSSRIPKRKVMSERGVNMTSVTQQIQSNIRKYHMERKIFQHLLDLKRLQIRSGQANESVLVKRAIDTYHNSVAASVGAGRYIKKDYTYRSFEQFLYQSLRMLQKSPVDHLKGLPETTDNPLLCTQSTHRCLHATHAYTGIPCAAYLPKMNHHTMPKIGFTPRSSSSFLPQINSKGKSVTLELCHGNDKQVISLPADRLDHNKRYYVTFTVKGQEGQSPVDQENTTSHRHAKSV